jgi:D-3-phosphoglycerate dehydrogenase
MKKPKICIPGPTRLSVGRELLEEGGCEFILGKSDDEFPGFRYEDGELIELAGDADVLWVTQRDVVTRVILEKCSRLQAVVKAVIGYETIDGSAATDLGILVCNSPARENFTGLAEATVGLISMLFKRLMHNQTLLRKGGWKLDEHRGNLMAGRTVGIIGVGRVGRETAKRLGPWEMRLIGYDPYITPESVAPFGVELVSFERVLRESDVVTLHVVLTEETRHFITLKEFKMMKPTAFLVNTSRGSVIREEDLIEALNERIIAGAALDVFEEEPLPMTSPLRGVDPTRLIVTPHVIGTNPQSQVAGQNMAAKSILCLLKGEVPENVVNPDAIDLWRRKFWS